MIGGGPPAVDDLNDAAPPVRRPAQRLDSLLDRMFARKQGTPRDEHVRACRHNVRRRSRVNAAIDGNATAVPGAGLPAARDGWRRQRKPAQPLVHNAAPGCRLLRLDPGVRSGSKGGRSGDRPESAGPEPRRPALQPRRSNTRQVVVPCAYSVPSGP